MLDDIPENLKILKPPQLRHGYHCMQPVPKRRATLDAGTASKL